MHDFSIYLDQLSSIVLVFWMSCVSLDRIFFNIVIQNYNLSFSGGLMLMLQDMALCEEADNTTLQPHHDLPGETNVHQGLKRMFIKSF